MSLILGPDTNPNILQATERLDDSDHWASASLTSLTQVGVLAGRQMYQMIPNATAGVASGVRSKYTYSASSSEQLTVSAIVAAAATGGIARTAAVAFYGADSGFASHLAAAFVNTSTGELITEQQGDIQLVDSSMEEIATGVYRVSITVTWGRDAWAFGPYSAILSADESDTVLFAGDATTPYGRGTALQAQWGALTEYNRRGAGV